MEDGTIDTNMSDTTEIIDDKGVIPMCQNLCPEQYLAPEMCKYLPFYSIHCGFLNYHYRENIDKFWRPHWSARCGWRKEDEPKTVKSLGREEVMEHGLNFKLH